MTPGEVRRLYFIIRTFLSYGLDELIPKMRITLPLRLWRYSLFWMPNRHKDKPLGERLRLALQELGPVWIKFGQMLSTRRDLFPPHIADQLALLQDRVAPFDGLRAKKQIEAARSVSSTAVEVPSEHAYSAASCNLEWQTTKTRQANESFAAASGEPLIRGKYENCND